MYCRMRPTAHLPLYMLPYRACLCLFYWHTFVEGILPERAAFVAASRGLCPRLLLHCAPVSAPAVPAPPTHKARHGADGRELCSSPLTCRVAVPLRPDLPLTLHYDGPSRTELGEGLGPWAGMRDEACRAEQLNALPLCAPLP